MVRRPDRHPARLSLGPLLVLVLVLGLARVLARETAAETAGGPIAPHPAREEPITPLPDPPALDPARLALGEALFRDHRLSHAGDFACVSCHDLATNGAGGPRPGQGMARLDTPTVFNSALDFRLNWEGNQRTLEAQARASLTSGPDMATTPAEVVRKLDADPAMVRAFRAAYGHPPDEASLLDAIVTFERSLLTPGGRFDQWLLGNEAALSPEERRGYELFKSLGCASCHQGVNVGGNLFERHGIFRPLASPEPEIVRVPSLRNVATTAPYFHDGSAPTLEAAVRAMAQAQLNQALTDEQIHLVVAFLHTLTGAYRGVAVKAPGP